MPNLRRKNGQYQARLMVKGKTVSRTFPTREAAETWTHDTQRELRLGRFADVERARKTTFGQLLDRYADTITPTKRSHNQELQRIRALRAHPIARVHLDELTTTEFAALRDELSQGRKPNTVRLYLTICQHAFKVAISEWGFSTLNNPLKGMRKPCVDNARDRRVSADELDRIVAAIGELRGPWFKWLFFFAIVCPQRRGELLKTTWTDVDSGLRRLKIALGKDGKPRYAPLAPAAMDILKYMPHSEDGRLFPLTANAVHMVWKGIRQKTGITDLHWQDLRHEGASRYALELGKDIFKLKVVTGHKDIRSLARYVNHKAEDVAYELAGGSPPPPPPLPIEEVLLHAQREKFTSLERLEADGRESGPQTASTAKILLFTPTRRLKPA